MIGSGKNVMMVPADETHFIVKVDVQVCGQFLDGFSLWVMVGDSGTANVRARMRFRRSYGWQIDTRGRRWKRMTEFERLQEIIAQLRGENGCPWDRSKRIAKFETGLRGRSGRGGLRD